MQSTYRMQPVSGVRGLREGGGKGGSAIFSGEGRREGGGLGGEDGEGEDGVFVDECLAGCVRQSLS